MIDSCNITFTEYSKCRSVLHVDDHRHFIIDNSGRDAINEFLSSCDEKEKYALYNYLTSKKRTAIVHWIAGFSIQKDYNLKIGNECHYYTISFLF